MGRGGDGGFQRSNIKLSKIKKSKFLSTSNSMIIASKPKEGHFLSCGFINKCSWTSDLLMPII